MYGQKGEHSVNKTRRTRHRLTGVPEAICLSSLACLLVSAAQAQAGLPSSPGQALAASASPQGALQQASGTVTGFITDATGDPVESARVVLTPNAGAGQTAVSDASGRFQFASVPAGAFKLTVTANGMTPANRAGILHPAESLDLPALKLGMATVDTSVDVSASREDLAEAEIHVEEQQRLAGFMPNFFVTYDWHAAPLSTRQKFELSWRNAIDPGNFIISAGIAGTQQAQDTFPGYGNGAAGYGKRVAAATGDLAIGTMLGGAVFPTLFHQDPRYFYKGTGTVKARLLYAVSRAFISRGDNGKSQPAYASILGDFTAGAISNFYYPAADRHGAGLTFEEGALNVVGDAVGNVVQEFIFRHLTPHAAHYASAAVRDSD